MTLLAICLNYCLRCKLELKAFRFVLIAALDCNFAFAFLFRCIVTKSSYTEDEDFTKADAVHDCIGDEGDERFTYAELAQSLLQGSPA